MSQVPWLDVALLLVLALYAGHGWRRGFLASAFSLGGFLAGAALAVWALPSLVTRWEVLDSVPALRAVVLVLAVLLVATLGQALGGAVGEAARARVRRPFAQAVDGALGAVTVLTVASLLVWFVADAVRGSALTSASRAVVDSRVVRAIDTVVPEGTSDLVAGVSRAMQEHGFPRVFADAGPEPIRPVPAPGSAAAQSAGVQAAARSVVAVTGTAPSCGEQLAGTGWVTAPERVVTNAHVVAGTTALVVRVGGTGRAREAEVVAFDPRRDLAVLAVPGLPASALPEGADLGAGEEAAVAGFPLAGPYTVTPARVRGTLRARGDDIYGRTGPVREIYSLRAEVRPGNSGGPVLDLSGRVVGVVFAASLDDPETGYALTLDEARPVIDAGVSATSGVSTGPCSVG
ncbi:MAG TPA: MarP family serine protease [Dermatophilaceae bacterium]|nr:MarP family serine protease [Dermatophilaceae bacterium]